MGFKPPRKTFLMKFEESHELHGLEVRVHSLALGQFLDTADLAGIDVEKIKANPGLVTGLYDQFIDAVSSWNLEDDGGQTLPVTRESLLTLDLDFVNQLIEAWMEAITENTSVKASDPLGNGSNSGATALEASLPMEPLSLSRAS